jgi:CubicO group peptidase (beta-lactamase class C family)
VRKLHSRISSIVLLIALPACSSSHLTGDDSETDYGSQIESILSDYRTTSIPGAAVRVIQNGVPVFTGAYGLAEVNSQIQVTPATNFRLASVTKQFTATSILLLVEDGLLSLNTTLPQVFPEFPAYGNGITVKNLLQHTSGLLAYESLVADNVTEQVHDRDVLQMMIEADHTYFPPGTSYRYSNSGYAVLAMMVTKLSGRSFATFLTERIFEPVGMKNTVAFEAGISTVPNRALGYTVTDGTVVLADQSLYSAVLGDGGIYSSLDDLTLWDHMQYSDDLLSADSKELMETPALESYGFGLRIDEYRGHRRLHHSGSTSGFRNHMVRFPDLELTVILLTNRAAPVVTPLSQEIADLFLPR